MGQKTNANIFRLGVTPKKKWDFRYYQKTPEEQSLYIFQDLAIKKFIERFLKLYGFLLHNYKLQFSKKTLYIYGSYLVEDKFISTINKLKTVKLKTLKEKIIFKRKKKKLYEKLKVLTKYKIFKKTNNFKNNLIFLGSKNLYIEQLLESLSLFTKKKYNITLILQNLNKKIDLYSRAKKKFIEKQKILLRQYEWNAKQNNKNLFFEPSFQILSAVVTTTNSAKFLAEFIAFYLTYMKTHTFFLKFIERLLSSFTKAYFSKISGIKIAIKGRFNRAQRAKVKLITIGKIPLQTIESYIDYYQSVSYTFNGTFGIKIWISQTK